MRLVREGGSHTMTDRPPLTIKRRNFVAMTLVGVFNGVLMGRLVDIQGIQSRQLQTMAKDIHFRGVPVAAFPGNIVDRRGRLLAGSHHVFSLFAVPAETRRRRAAEVVQLAELLQMPVATVRRRVSRRQGFVWIRRRLTGPELDRLRPHLAEMPGIYVVAETARYYPENSLAGPVLGFSGIDNQGLAGLELIYDRELTGKPGSIQIEYDASGRTMRFSRQELVPPVPGDTLELSLDETIQWMAEQAAEQAMAATSAKAVDIVVMDPKTGGILAMAQRPTFDPNRHAEYPPRAQRILAVQDAIPPGSIFKPVTLAAALDAGTTSPAAGFYCPGFKIVLGRRVNCWRPGGHGAQTLAEVVQNSCNVGFMELGLGLGLERFYRYVARFGLMGRTHVDLPGEARGIFPRMRAATALDLAVMAFGQTLTVTPIGLLTAVAAIANGGRMIRPHVGRRLMTPSGRVVRVIGGQPVRQVVSESVARLVQRMMVGVVARGTGKLAQVPGYQVAGKTGTAQKVVAGRVEKGIYIASFIGFAPVPDPAVAMLVSVDEPQGAFYGGQVAAPVFGRLLRDVLRYLHVAPTEPVAPPPAGQPAMVPSLVNLDPATALQDAEVFGFPVQFSGTGDVVVNQSITYGAWRPAGTLIGLQLGKRPRIYLEWVTVPNFFGRTVSEAARLALDLGINAQVIGRSAGVIQGQSIPPGRQVREGTGVLLIPG